MKGARLGLAPLRVRGLTGTTQRAHITSGDGEDAPATRGEQRIEQVCKAAGGHRPARRSGRCGRAGRRPLPRPPGTFADCNPPSRTVIQNYECSTALSQGSVNGYVQGQIQLGINYGVYKAFSSSEPFQ